MVGVKDAVQACYDSHRVAGLATVQVQIGDDGRIHATRIKGMFAGTPTGGCVEAAVRTARFKRFSGSLRPYEEMPRMQDEVLGHQGDLREGAVCGEVEASR
jgi:hypothetical protein